MIMRQSSYEFTGKKNFPQQLPRLPKKACMHIDSFCSSLTITTYVPKFENGGKTL